MSKKDFIALADMIRVHNADRYDGDISSPPFSQTQINVLATFCRTQNPAFNRDRWLDYIAGTNGPSGGAR